MTRKICEKCGRTVDGRFFNIDIMAHIKNEHPITGMTMIVDGQPLPVSGKMFTVELCLKCYNEIMFEFWKTIKNDINLLNDNRQLGG